MKSALLSQIRDTRIREGREECSRFFSLGVVRILNRRPESFSRYVLAIGAYILVAELSKLTTLHYVSKEGGREWFRYRFQTSRF